MRYFDRRPREALFVLGTISILTGYLISGELFYGYSQSLNAVLLHLGVFTLLLSSTVTLCAQTSLRADFRGLIAALLALCLLYPLAVGFIWYDLVVTPPPHYGGNPTLGNMARNRLSFLLALSPITTGVVAGAYVATAQAERSIVVPILTVAVAIGGPLVGYSLAVRSGAHGGFTMPLYLLLATGAAIGSLPLGLFTKLEYASPREEK